MADCAAAAAASFAACTSDVGSDAARGFLALFGDGVQGTVLCSSDIRDGLRPGVLDILQGGFGVLRGLFGPVGVALYLAYKLLPLAWRGRLRVAALCIAVTAYRIGDIGGDQHAAVRHALEYDAALCGVQRRFGRFPGHVQSTILRNQHGHTGGLEGRCHGQPFPTIAQRDRKLFVAIAASRAKIQRRPFRRLGTVAGQLDFVELQCVHAFTPLLFAVVKAALFGPNINVDEGVIDPHAAVFAQQLVGQRVDLCGRMAVHADVSRKAIGVLRGLYPALACVVLRGAVGAVDVYRQAANTGSVPSLQANSRTLKCSDSLTSPSVAREYAFTSYMATSYSSCVTPPRKSRAFSRSSYTLPMLAMAWEARLFLYPGWLRQ